MKHFSKDTLKLLPQKIIILSYGKLYSFDSRLRELFLEMDLAADRGFFGSVVVEVYLFCFEILCIR